MLYSMGCKYVDCFIKSILMLLIIESSWLDAEEYLLGLCLDC